MNNCNNKPTDQLIKCATVLSIGGLITKLLGAIYRIPLTAILGSKGIGVYQTAFPVYCILLTFSSTGLPSAISKIISSGYGENTVIKKALKLFIPLGFISSFIMFVFSGYISKLQGNPESRFAYLMLAPSIFLVSAISCYRGYFQGKMNMFPTAISQIIEQSVKLTVGLLLCYFIKGEPWLRGGLACLAVTVSELVALVYLFFKYKKSRCLCKTNLFLSYPKLILTLLPITLSTILIPLSRVFDSFTIINIMSNYTKSASSYYGIYTGSVESVVSLPVAICYGISATVLPQISKSITAKNFGLAKKHTFQSISLSLFFSCVFGLGLFIFGGLITKILFNSLSQSEKLLTAKLISLSFFSVIGLSLLQTCTSCLVGFNKPLVPCVFLAVGLVFKFTTQIFLVKNPKINVFGVLYSDILCYFLAVFLDLLYIIFITKFKDKKNDDYPRRAWNKSW